MKRDSRVVGGKGLSDQDHGHDVNNSQMNAETRFARAKVPAILI